MRTSAGIGLGMLALAEPALAADLPVKAPAISAVYDWTGFYLGGHFGYGAGSLGPDTNALPLQGVFLPHSVTGLLGGYQMGYNRELANHVVLGFEADATFPGPMDQAALARTAPAPFNTTIDYFGTARGRIGYAFGPWMPYMTGGFAWGHPNITINDGSGAISSAGPRVSVSNSPSAAIGAPGSNMTMSILVLRPTI
jgi:high affinity Mn2+ porin